MQSWCHMRERRKAVNVTKQLLCTKKWLKIVKYIAFGWCPQMPYKVNPSIPILEKLNNLSKPQMCRRVSVFQNIFSSLFHAISQAKEKVI